MPQSGRRRTLWRGTRRRWEKLARADARADLAARLPSFSESQFFSALALEAARSTEYSLLMDDALELFGKQLKDKICTSTNILSESAPQPDVHQDEALLSAARLKKKEVQPRSSKRHRSWLDKTRKYKKKVPNKTTVCCWKPFQYSVFIYCYFLNSKVYALCSMKRVVVM